MRRPQPPVAPMRRGSMFHSAPFARMVCTSTGRVVQAGFHRRFDILLHRLQYEAIVDRGDRNARIQIGLYGAGAVAALVATHPAAAVDQEDDRRRFVTLGLPEIEFLPLGILAVSEIGHRGLGAFRRRLLGRLSLGDAGPHQAQEQQQTRGSIGHHDFSERKDANGRMMSQRAALAIGRLVQFKRIKQQSVDIVGLENDRAIADGGVAVVKRPLKVQAEPGACGAADSRLPPPPPLVM